MPIKDFYSRDEEAPKYDPNRLEVNDELSVLILKIENVLFTRKGEVMGVADFGCNLSDLVFSLVINESVIQERINRQIQSYCLQNFSSDYNIDTRVSFYSTESYNGALVDIFINDTRVIGALF